jgi:DNA-binding NarL/FixJ family response regulator
VVEYAYFSKIDRTFVNKEIKKQSLVMKVLVPTVHKSEENILATLRSGADSYIVKDVATHKEIRGLSRTVSFRRGDMTPVLQQESGSRK